MSSRLPSRPPWTVQHELHMKLLWCATATAWLPTLALQLNQNQGCKIGRSRKIAHCTGQGKPPEFCYIFFNHCGNVMT